MLKFQVNFDDPYMARLKRPVEFDWPCHVYAVRYGTGKHGTGREEDLAPESVLFQQDSHHDAESPTIPCLRAAVPAPAGARASTPAAEMP